MRALLVRVVILFVLLGAYNALRPAEVDGQWGIQCQTCQTCRGGYGGYADCRPTSNEGWVLCQEATQDPSDPMRGYCNLAFYCDGTL